MRDLERKTREDMRRDVDAGSRTYGSSERECSGSRLGPEEILEAAGKDRL